MGAIIQDKRGGFFATGAASYHNDILVVEAKAQAVLFGQQMAADFGISSIEVESDSQTLVCCYST